MKRLLTTTPFLDLTYHFAIDIQALSQRARAVSRKGHKPILGFDKFKKHFEGGLSDLALHFRTEFDQEGSSCDTLLTSAEFLRQLPDASFTTDRLEEHVSRFEAYYEATLQGAKANVDSLRCFGVSALIEPFLSCAQREHESEWTKKCVARLEVLIKRAQDSLLSRDADVPSLLEFKNNLLFAYVVICDALRVGLSAAVFSYHLFLHRAFSLTRWASLTSQLRIQYAALCLAMAQRFFPPERPFKTQLGVSFNALADLRSVLEDAVGASSEQSLLMHLYVFRWFLDKLEAEAFSVQNDVTGLRALPTLSNGEQGAVVELVRRFTSYRYPVTANHLETFLLQFGSTNRIRATIRFLSSIRFYPLWQLAEAVEQILRAEISQHGELIIAPLGDLTGSASIIGYLASHSRLKKLHFVEDVTHALAATRSGGRIYFVDDCALSGTQTLNFVGDLVGTRQLKKHHTRYCQPLADRQQRELSRRTTVFVYCLACDGAVDRLNAELAVAGLSKGTYEVLPATLEPLSVKAFGSMSPVPWASSEERDDLMRFCADVGYDLLGERAVEKSWTDERRRESSLGYSDFQKLIVFPYTVPKSTVTLLWAHGGSERQWVPLFPVIN